MSKTIFWKKIGKGSWINLGGSNDTGGKLIPLRQRSKAPNPGRLNLFNAGGPFARMINDTMSTRHPLHQMAHVHAMHK